MKKYETGASKRTMDYLVAKVKNNETIPNLTQMGIELAISRQTLSACLIRLANKGKIKYRKGQVLMVQIPQANAQFERTFKTVKQEEKMSTSELKQRYDEIVKEIITNFIKAIPSEELNAESIMQYSTSILNITNNIKEKLFKEIKNG